MTAVLSAFRDNEEKVAAAVAECRRLGIEVRPPDVLRSATEFTVEDDAIRFGLLAVKNVGQGAIESIVEARLADGPFRSLADLCTRIDLRLANRKVLESLAKVGALNAFGHPAQVLEGLDEAIAAGQAAQHDRLTGQTSLFDLGVEDATTFERPLPTVAEAPVRERLRWEKELLGLYLSEHPMGEIADQVGDFVTAYSGDLRDESLDGQRIVVAGIVVGSRTIITRARATMAAVTLEDLQGSLEVVVFPRLYEQTLGTWADGAILLVAGRVDHRGEEVSLLADLVLPWDEAAALGPEALARQVAAGERGSARRRVPVGPGGPPGSPAAVIAPPGGPAAGARGGARPTERWTPDPELARGRDAAPDGNGHRNGNGNGTGPAGSGPVRGLGRRPEIPYVSPLRGGRIPDAGPLELPGAAVATVATVARASGAVADLPAIAPPEPILNPGAASDEGPASGERDVEPALPEEARAREAAEAASPTSPLAGPGAGQVLHVRFSRAPSVQLVPAMEALRQVIRERPGQTSVVVHVPGPGGDSLPMPLRTAVAYDAELIAEIRRRVGDGVVELSLA